MYNKKERNVKNVGIVFTHANFLTHGNILWSKPARLKFYGPTSPTQSTPPTPKFWRTTFFLTHAKILWTNTTHANGATHATRAKHDSWETNDKFKLKILSFKPLVAKIWNPSQRLMHTWKCNNTLHFIMFLWCILQSWT